MVVNHRIVAGQFRATSFRDKSGRRTAISTTEDLRGVFFYLGAK